MTAAHIKTRQPRCFAINTRPSPRDGHSGPSANAALRETGRDAAIEHDILIQAHLRSETHGILPVSLLLKARRRAADPRIAALAETYPSLSDGSGNRRAAVLQTPAPQLRSGFRGHPATRLQTRVDLVFSTEGIH